MNRHLTAIVEREGDGYVASCPEFDIASQGETVSEARENLAEALTLFFESASAQEVVQLRGEGGMGVSEAVNILLRRGLLAESSLEPFVQQTTPLGVRIDVTNVAEAIDLLEGHQAC